MNGDMRRGGQVGDGGAEASREDVNVGKKLVPSPRVENSPPVAELSGYTGKQRVW